MKTTMKEVAEYCGVSVTTVSYCLNGNSEIPERTKEKVFKAAKELNYVPNAQARGLKSKRTFNIGVFIPDFDGPVHHRILSGISDQIQKENPNYHVIVTIADNSFNLVKGCSVDLAIIMDSRTNKDLIKELAEIVPIIVFDIDVNYPNVYKISIDNFNGMYNEVNDLIKTGSKKIAYLLGSSSSIHNKERYNGYVKALTDNNIEFDSKLVYDADAFTESRGYQVISNLLDSKQYDFDTLVCSNDELALGSIRALQEHHINIPKDIKVAGFDNIDKGILISPNLSTVNVDWNECGKKISSYALKILGSKKQLEEDSIVIEATTVKRESTF